MPPDITTRLTTNGVARKTAMGASTDGSRPTAARPPASRLSRPGDIAKASRPPPSKLSRPGDVAKSQKPPSRVLSRPGHVMRSNSAPKALQRSKAKPRVTEMRAIQKRKSASPSMPAFDSDSEGESDAEIDDGKASKKPRLSSEPPTKDHKRQIRNPDSWSGDGMTATDIVSGADLVARNSSRDFSDWFESGIEDSPATELELAYPNPAMRERFIILAPKRDEFRPHEDICETMRETLQHYFPVSESRKHLDEASGIPFRLIRALNRKHWSEYRSIVDEYNRILNDARANNTLQLALDEMPSMPLPLVQRILDQITARTISPHTELLQKYENFSRNTYGELMAPFNSHIFRATRMNSSSVFVDLGSGVGNVVLQAALEVGCESHGIEEMPNCCKLARDQEAEFSSRCKMWGLSHGTTNLMAGNFLEDPRLPAILQRADVVLVNNVLFPPQVNEQLTSLFLDLKDGARIVSLKTFVPEGWHLSERTRESIEGMLEVEKRFFWDGCVSWTSKGGDYFVATKDPNRIERILGKT